MLWVCGLTIVFLIKLATFQGLRHGRSYYIESQSKRLVGVLFFDVRDSIRSIEANGLNRVMDGQFQANIPELPLIHYGRKPNIIIPESNAADVQHAVINLDSGENAEVYMRRIQVDYTVFFNGE